MSQRVQIHVANDDEMGTTRDVLLAAEVIEAWLALPENRDLPEDNKYRTVQRKLVDSVRSQLGIGDRKSTDESES